jgi:hypothetical protein
MKEVSGDGGKIVIWVEAISCEFVNVGNVQQFSQAGVELSK